jgi:hypothetical protein
LAPAGCIVCTGGGVPWQCKALGIEVRCDVSRLSSSWVCSLYLSIVMLQIGAALCHPGVLSRQCAWVPPSTRALGCTFSLQFVVPFLPLAAMIRFHVVVVARLRLLSKCMQRCAASYGFGNSCPSGQAIFLGAPCHIEKAHIRPHTSQASPACWTAPQNGMACQLGAKALALQRVIVAVAPLLFCGRPCAG